MFTFSSFVVADNMSNERKQAFVDLVKQYPVLLSRSQLPHIKEQKALALSSLVDEFKEQLGIKFNRLNLQKKILNLKRQITKKATEQKGNFICLYCIYIFVYNVN